MIVLAIAVVLQGIQGAGRRWSVPASLPFVIGFLAATAFALEATFPSDWIEMIGVTLVITAFSTGWHVVRTFIGFPVRYLYVLLIPFAHILLSVLVFFPWQLDNMASVYRTANMLALNMIIARELAPGRAPELPSRLLLRAVFLIFAATSALRIIFSSWLPSPLGTATFEVWSMATYNITIVFQAVVTAVLLVAMIREREASISEAIALHDPMTGALNRRALEQHSAKFSFNEQPLTVLAFDLDHFKNINDRFGHSVGDAVICTAVETARSILRKDDVVFRLGGEEFACVLLGVTTDSGFLIAERLCRNFERAGQEVAGQKVEATMSIGVASAAPGTSIALQELIAEADRGLYIAKHQGRNCVAEAV